MTLRQAQGPAATCTATSPSSRSTLSAELAGAGVAPRRADVAEYALWLGDDALILSQQLGAWIARAPELEEDVALGNIALDLLGHARSLLRYAGTCDGRTEDDLAYWRDEPEFRCAWLFEQPNGDFAQTIARQLAASVYQFELYRRFGHRPTRRSRRSPRRRVKEVEYHRDHAMQWTLRLARRHRRVAAADAPRDRRRLALRRRAVPRRAAHRSARGRRRGAAVGPARRASTRSSRAVFAEAGLDVPGARLVGRRAARPALPTLGYLLAEMQVLARQHPGATW